MLFHTWQFGFFWIVTVIGLAFVFLIRQFAPRSATAIWLTWLLVGSYWFYGTWSVYYLTLIVYSTLIDYACVLAMDYGDRVPEARWASRRFWLAVSLVNNLGLLGFFKYANFFISNINEVLMAAGSPSILPPTDVWLPAGWDMVLPVGISFYTFQSLSYTIDFYRREIPVERSIVKFATYVAFFPQLVAGPIERSAHLLPQFQTVRGTSLLRITDGASLFLVGLFKKVALANYVSLYADRVFARHDQYDAAALVVATVCFAWQIYFDFSGYSDMARGIARAMGFDLMLNFRNPYTATGLGDFWARWHISLSTWFRDYVYIPLGGNRAGTGRIYRNLLIVFVVSGFWHGAGWNYIIWGALHAVGVMATRMCERSGFYRRWIPKFVKQIAVFLFVCLAWIFFRAETVESALHILHGIATRPWTNPNCPLLMIVLVAAVWMYQLILESRWSSVLKASWLQPTLATAMLIYLVLCAAEGGSFIYFQF
jgi:D-alanyl-lipoteichoic acid acyltransferase DltB (MBOAT superfamily)